MQVQSGDRRSRDPGGRIDVLQVGNKFADVGRLEAGDLRPRRSARTQRAHDGARLRLHLGVDAEVHEAAKRLEVSLQGHMRDRSCRRSSRGSRLGRELAAQAAANVDRKGRRTGEPTVELRVEAGAAGSDANATAVHLVAIRADGYLAFDRAQAQARRRCLSDGVEVELANSQAVSAHPDRRGDGRGQSGRGRFRRPHLDRQAVGRQLRERKMQRIECAANLEIVDADGDAFQFHRNGRALVSESFKGKSIGQRSACALRHELDGREPVDGRDHQLQTTGRTPDPHAETGHVGDQRAQYDRADNQQPPAPPPDRRGRWDVVGLRGGVHRGADQNEIAIVKWIRHRRSRSP